jgi:hypothetical protein
MPEGELRMAFVLASETPSRRAEESGSRSLSVKHRSDEVRGAEALRHRHLERVWFAHIDDPILNIMMSGWRSEHLIVGEHVKRWGYFLECHLWSACLS